MEDIKQFNGVKAALILDDKLLVIRRDNKPEINWPNMIDLPGGGREGTETPYQCVSREINEELGIEISEKMLLWGNTYPSENTPGTTAAFMVFELASEQVKQIRFGDEGIEWKLVAIQDFLNDEEAIGYLKVRLQDYLVASNR